MPEVRHPRRRLRFFRLTPLEMMGQGTNRKFSRLSGLGLQLRLVVVVLDVAEHPIAGLGYFAHEDDNDNDIYYDS